MFPSCYNIQTSTLPSVNHIEHANMGSLVWISVAKCKLHVLWVALSDKAKLDVAKSMILSYFNYSNILYGICTDEDRGELQKLQNNIIRSALGVRRKKIQLLVCVHKAVYNGYIPLKENVWNLRMFDALVVQLYQPSCTKFKKTPLYLGGDHLNDLPVEIRNIEDFDYW